LSVTARVNRSNSAPDVNSNCAPGVNAGVTAGANVGVGELLTAEAVARLLAISVPTLRRWVREGVWPAPIRLGRRLLWEAETVRRVLDRARKGAR
jgi:excisionase family DNA binding protein